MTTAASRLVEEAWCRVSGDFDATELFGTTGAQFLEELSARRCLHPMAVAMSVLPALAPLSNGAAVRIWSDPSPLCVVAVLVNPAQSRKSQTCSLVRELGWVLDAFAHDRERCPGGLVSCYPITSYHLFRGTNLSLTTKPVVQEKPPREAAP